MKKNLFYSSSVISVLGMIGILLMFCTRRSLEHSDMQHLGLILGLVSACMVVTAVTHFVPNIVINRKDPFYSPEPEASRFDMLFGRVYVWVIFILIAATLISFFTHLHR